MTWTMLDECVLRMACEDNTDAIEFLADWLLDAEWHEPPAKLRAAGWMVSNG